MQVPYLIMKKQGDTKRAPLFLVRDKDFDTNVRGMQKRTSGANLTIGLKNYCLLICKVVSLLIRTQLCHL